MAEVADAALPTFPFRINWSKGISERLEWKTDVLGDFTGNEQRRALRLTPRREFEVTLLLWDQDRQFWDLWCHRMAGTEFLLPLWHDSVRTPQAAPQGQKTIWCDTRALEFQIGSYGLLRGRTALSYERFLIAEVHDDRIVTVANLISSWPKGTRVEPMIRARMTDQTDVTAKSSRVSETQAVFEATHEQPYSEGVDSFDQYLGTPVLSGQPNRTDDLTQAFQWAFSEADSQTGRRYRRSDTGRAIVHQKHSWMLKGRTAKAEFRSMLYRLRGSAKPVWLPTFSEDVTISRPVAAGTSIWCKAFGFAYTGGVSSGRQHLMIRLHDGTRLYRRVTGTAISGTLTEERLVLDTALPAIPLQQIACVSWIDTSRFENDRIELTHVNAADGVTTVTGVFQSFRDERTAPVIISYPIPEAPFLYNSCGPDAPIEPDRCAPVFNGVYLTVRLSAPNPCNACWDGNRDIAIVETQPNGPGGRVIGGFGFYGGGCGPYTTDVYENNVEGNPRLQGQLLARFHHNTFNDWYWEFFFPCTFVQVHIFISSRYCGSVGKDEGTMAVSVTYADGTTTVYGPKPAGGLYQLYFPDL